MIKKCHSTVKDILNVNGIGRGYRKSLYLGVESYGEAGVGAAKSSGVA
jgi:hypothetical protein